MKPRTRRGRFSSRVLRLPEISEAVEKNVGPAFIPPAFFLHKASFLLPSELLAYTDSMVSIIQNVKDVDTDTRQALEHVVGQPLRTNQQVVIRVIDVDEQSGPGARSEALARAAEIARRGRAVAAAQEVSECEVDTAIEQAIQQARRQKKSE
jgi:hypothetical protein